MAGGHCGYEFCPFVPTLSNLLLYVALPKTVWLKWTTFAINSVKHHDMHHSHVIFHYSLYFTHWDRLLQTLHPSYDGHMLCEGS